MDRRPAGIVVLILAACIVVVVPSLDGRRVPGSASSVSFPDPPSVGDCLRSPLPTTIALTGAVAEARLTELDIGTCTASVSGEIVGFWPTAAAAREAPSSRFGGPCYRQAAEFAGLESTSRTTDLPGAPSSSRIRWKPTISFQPVEVVPGEQEQRAGRTWSACLVVPLKGQSYRGTLRDAVTTGLPAAFAACWAGTDLGLLPEVQPCGEPHRAELVATGWVRNRSLVTVSEISKSCVGVAGRLTGAADATRDGQLEIVADRMTGQTDGRSDGPLAVGCFVTAADGQQLSDSVIGLGERAVPLAQSR